MSSSTEYVSVQITDAQPGDEVRQAGEWVAVESVSFVHGQAVIRWAGGGSMSCPISHRPAVRRAVVVEQTPEQLAETYARVTGSRAARVAVERRLPSGELVLEAVGEYVARPSWVVKSFNGRGARTAHATRPGRQALCGTPLGYGNLRTASAHEIERGCKRCAKLAVVETGR